MAEPPSTITTVNGRRCTRVRRTTTLLAGNVALRRLECHPGHG